MDAVTSATPWAADFPGADAAAVDAVAAEAAEAACNAVTLDIDPACGVERADFNARSPGQRAPIQAAWDAAAEPYDEETWCPDWNWLLLMKQRIRRSYRVKPRSLAWVFDKVEVEAFCDGACGERISVPRVASWYEGSPEQRDAVARAVEADIPFIVKPTHGSQALAVAAFTSPSEAGAEAVHQAIDAALHAAQDVTEPWMLRSLQRGVLVQDLYQSEMPCAMLTPPYQCPLELKVQTLFGRVICGTVRAFPWQLVVLRNGSIHQWSRARVVHSQGLPKAWRDAWGVRVPPDTMLALRKVLAADWGRIRELSETISTRSRLDEVRVDWLLGDPRLGPRVGELQYIGAAGNIRPELQLPLCHAFLHGHRQRRDADANADGGAADEEPSALPTEARDVEAQAPAGLVD